MPAKKSNENSQRKYHADGYTYDQRKESFSVFNAEDEARKAAVKKKLEMGGVGPETPELHKARMAQRQELLYKTANERFTPSGQKLENKSRGTGSSSVRRILN